MGSGEKPGQRGKCLSQVCAVVQLPADLNIRLVRIQGERSDSLGPVHLINVIAQERLAAVLVLRDHMVYRHIGRRPVMLRPVKLDAAGDPRSGQSNQRRFDHTVVVNKVIVVCLIQRALDTAAQFRKDHDLQVVIFQPDRVPDFICPGEADLLSGRVRIQFSARSLIHSFLKEHRILVCLSCLIGLNLHILFPDYHFTHIILHPRANDICPSLLYTQDIYSFWEGCHALTSLPSPRKGLTAGVAAAPPVADAPHRQSCTTAPALACRPGGGTNLLDSPVNFGRPRLTFEKPWMM